MSVNISISSKVIKDESVKQEERKLRQEASRLVSMANRRIKRLEEQDLLKSPAYIQYVENGKQKFGIRGKNTEQVKQEIAKMEHFLNMKTSRVAGTKDYLKNVANSVHISQWYNMKDLQNKLNSFFVAVEKLRDYMLNSKEYSVAIGYAKLHEIVGEYVEEKGLEIDKIEDNLIEMADKISEAIGYGEVDSLLDEMMNNYLE